MAEENNKGWRFNRQIDLTFVLQLLFLASLIVGSWVNLQRQLDLLQKDVSILLESQRRFESDVEQLSAKTLEYEYRLRAMEKNLVKNNNEIADQ